MTSKRATLKESLAVGLGITFVLTTLVLVADLQMDLNLTRRAGRIFIPSEIEIEAEDVSRKVEYEVLEG